MALEKGVLRVHSRLLLSILESGLQGRAGGEGHRQTETTPEERACAVGPWAPASCLGTVGPGNVGDKG